MRVVLLGAPGSGKGTQAEIIIKRYRMLHISTGDLLRAQAAAGTPLGLQVKEIMEAGGLVSDEIVLGIIEHHLTVHDVESGFLLDGFPRTLPQAQALDALLDKLNLALDVVLFFDVDYAEVTKRLLARHRSDDTEQAIRKRLQVYEAQTIPLIDYYRQRGLLHTVQALGKIEAISERIYKILEKITG